MNGRLLAAIKSRVTRVFGSRARASECGKKPDHSAAIAGRLTGRTELRTAQNLKSEDDRCR
jgi:hypothetical protein